MTDDLEERLDKHAIGHEVSYGGICGEALDQIRKLKEEVSLLETVVNSSLYEKCRALEDRIVKLEKALLFQVRLK